MTPATVEKLAETLERLRFLIAIEQLVAAQAVDLRGLPVQQLGTGPRALYDAVRADVAPLDEDRPLGPDVERRARGVCRLTTDDEAA